MRPKDTVDRANQDGVVCRILCQCGKVYIGKTGKSVQERFKKHNSDIRLARNQTSAVAEHAHETGHYLIWNEVRLLIEVLNGTRVASRKISTYDFTLITSTRIAELKFLKHGYPRSKDTTTGKRYNSGPLRKQLLARTMTQ